MSTLYIITVWFILMPRFLLLHVHVALTLHYDYIVRAVIVMQSCMTLCYC